MDRESKVKWVYDGHVNVLLQGKWSAPL
jgi:hypothetical protein